jgi:hypothetical protein
MHSVLSFPRRPVPPLARIRQDLDPTHVPDVRRETHERLRGFGLRDKLPRGGRVAITAGSRGIGGFLELLAGIVDAVKEAGGEPFLIPAMGSHGGATPEGQMEILRRFGVSDAAVGAPIKATMETVTLEAAKNGAAAHLDRIAAEADGIIVLGRVKTHPENAEGLASGLLKMVTVGLGKQIGAQEAHRHGLWDSVREVPRVTMGRAKTLCGVAVVENAYRQPVCIEIVPPTYEAFRDADRRLLLEAQKHLAKIPFNQLDLLIVDELGKSISGTGMDLNVIGKWRAVGGKREPNYRRIVALSLTRPSLGNGLGIGLADFTTRRFADQYDPAVTYVNLLTASEPGGTAREGPLPLALPSDREAIEVALYSAIADQAARVCRIKNTAALEEMWVSEALLEEVRKNPHLRVEEATAPLPFDGAGNLF